MTETTIIIWVVLIAAYWLPTIVAAIRKMPNVDGVAVVNGLTGWTGIGWIAALVMACSQNTRVIDLRIEDTRNSRKP